MSEEPQWTAWKAYLDSLFKPGGSGYAAIAGYCVDPSERIARRLFWRDDMEAYTTCRWTPIGAAVVAYIDSVRAFEGDYVLSLTNLANTWAECFVQFGMFPPVKSSVELRWWRNANIHTMRSSFTLNDGVNTNLASVQWSYAAGRWEYMDGAGVLTPVPGGQESIDNDTWNYLKLIVDWETKTYTKLITTGLEIDMSGIPVWVSPLAVPSYSTQVALDKDSPFGIFQPAYFDDVRIYLKEV